MLNCSALLFHAVGLASPPVQHRFAVRFESASMYVFVHMTERKRPGGDMTPTVRKMRVDDNSAWNTGKRWAGITNFRFHDLRHTKASWLIQAGVPLSALQEMGGRESIEMVQRYAHLSPSHLTEQARKIDEVLVGNVTNLALWESVAVGE